jgi:hypothetical protein
LPDTYLLPEHRRRFAAWAAGRAASTKGCRFAVEQGKGLLEKAGLHLLAEPKDLPGVAEFDEFHLRWRNQMLAEANTRHLSGFTHGVTAKLINVYLKAKFVCGGYADEKVNALHPPIDSLLLTELAIREPNNDLKRIWVHARTMKWSKFDEKTYWEVIQAIRRKVDGRPLWAIEQYWCGHQ